MVPPLLPSVVPLYRSLSVRLALSTPLGLPISKRDGLLEKWAMFRDSGGPLSRHPSLDSGLDGPYSSGASKLEQVTRAELY